MAYKSSLTYSNIYPPIFLPKDYQVPDSLQPPLQKDTPFGEEYKEDDYYEDEDLDEEGSFFFDDTDSPFPGCCGILVLSEFYYTDERPKNYLKRVREKLRNIQNHTSQGLQLVALNNLQQEGLEKVLLEEGFKIYEDNFFHGAHGNTITLYGRLTWTPELKKAHDIKQEKIRALSSVPLKLR